MALVVVAGLTLVLGMAVTSDVNAAQPAAKPKLDSRSQAAIVEAGSLAVTVKGRPGTRFSLRAQAQRRDSARRFRLTRKQRLELPAAGPLSVEVPLLKRSRKLIAACRPTEILLRTRVRGRGRIRRDGAVRGERSAKLRLDSAACGRPGKPDPPDPPDPPELTYLEQGPLHPDGRWIEDETGRTVILQGIFGVRKPIFPAAADTDVLQPAYVAYLEDLGLNAYRLAYQWEGLQPDGPDTWDLDYLDRIEGLQDNLADHGIFSLIDSHQDLYAQKYGPVIGTKAHGNGAPEWAAYDDGVPAPEGPLNLGSPANYFHPSTSRAFDNFWLDRKGVLDDYAEQWQVIAGRFAGDPHLLGYDLMNEPWPGTLWPTCLNPVGCPVFDLGLLQPAMNRWAEAIREVDQETMVFYEPHFLFDSGVGNSFGPPPASAGPSAFGFHDICVARALRQGNDALKEIAKIIDGELCPVLHEQVVKNGMAVAERMGVPPYMSEFIPADETDRQGLECLLERAERYQLGWTFGRYPRDHGLADKNDDVLARVFPRATAGEPVDYAFDPRTGHFDFTYVPDHAIDEPTFIVAPELHYPEGYEATVTGGSVVSDPNAPHLLVEPAPGASEVTVEVRPPAGDPTPRSTDLPDCSHFSDDNPIPSVP